MKALILVGGYGTRLRPLTLSVPKPLIHFCNRPMIEYQIRAAAAVGVKKIILAVAYEPDAMQRNLAKFEKRYGVEIVCSIEKEPLLTAGPIRLARDHLFTDAPETGANTEAPANAGTSAGEAEDFPNLFFVFNSDIICNFPLRQMLKTFLAHPSAEGVIACTKVKDPSAFGVILSEQKSGLIEKFVEKPSSWVGDDINAGFYLLDRSIVDGIPARPTSLEREIFPQMVARRSLYAFHMDGFWADIGKPLDFLLGTKLYLQALRDVAEKETQDRCERDRERVRKRSSNRRGGSGSGTASGGTGRTGGRQDEGEDRSDSSSSDSDEELSQGAGANSHGANSRGFRGIRVNHGWRRDSTCNQLMPHASQMSTTSASDASGRLIDEVSNLGRNPRVCDGVCEGVCGSVCEGVCERVCEGVCEGVCDEDNTHQDNKRMSGTLSGNAEIVGNVLIHPTATIGPGCKIGPDVTIGPRCVLGAGVRIERTALMAGVRIADFSYVNQSIIGWDSRVGRWVRIEGLTVLGQDVSVDDQCLVNAAFVLPNKTITKSIFEPGTIVM